MNALRDLRIWKVVLYLRNLQHSPFTQLLAPLGQEVQAPPTV